MHKAVILGIQPSEYERLTPGGVRELFGRLEKHREEEAKGEAEQKASEFDANQKAIGNVVKALNNTNELLKKVAERPSL